ncbi:MAG: baseplate J/gp47 family protein, partial [Proteobacteria bacterium]|nr:baseplate J/gp47 family protein [Pseudomonadota bacterium]
LYPFDTQPARVDITFENVTAEKTIEAGRQVITEVGGERIVFETEEGFTLNPVSLKSVITSYDSQTIDNTEANEEDDIYFYAFGEKALVGAKLLLGFDKPLPEKEIHITFDLFEEDFSSPGSHDDDREREQVSPSAHVVIWEYLNDGKLKTITPKKDTTSALTRSGRIVFTGPSDMDKKDGFYWLRCRLKEGRYEIVPQINKILLNTISAVQVETMKDGAIGTGIPEQKVLLNKVPVISGITGGFSMFSVGDVLDWPGLLQQFKDQAGSGKPSPGKRIWSMFDLATQNSINQWKGDQEPGDALKYETINALNNVLESRDLYEINAFKDIKFIDDEAQKLLSKGVDFISDTEVKALNRFLIEEAYPDKIAKNRMSIQIQRENGDWENWHEVYDFESSGPDDPHYMFDPEKGEVTFGNGLNGRIPVESQPASYKTTLGAKGNIPEGQKWWINKEGFEGIKGKNQKAATGGKDAEPLENAKARAKKDFRERYRAITSEDYERLALSTPGLRVA